MHGGTAHPHQLTDHIGHPPASGLAQAFATGGTLGTAAKHACASGLDLAMIIGAAGVLLSAAITYRSVPGRPVRQAGVVRRFRAIP